MNDTPEETARATRRNLKIKTFSMSCFFCGSIDDPVNLHECEILALQSKIKHIAKALSDTAILAKLSQEDMVATEARYHNRCLVSYNNKFRTTKKKEFKDTIKDKLASGLVLP